MKILGLGYVPLYSYTAYIIIYIYIHIPKIGVPQIVQNYIGHFSIETPGGLDNTSILGNLHL